MQKHRFKYIALWGFLIGILFIVFLQFITNQNINRLIQGNKNLLYELSIQNELRKIEANILTIESDIRGAVIAEHSLANVQDKISDIEDGLIRLEGLLHKKNKASRIDDLEGLINRKILFSYQIIDTFNAKGKLAAEQLINKNKGKEIRDSIVQLISYLDAERQKEFHTITGSVERNGMQARTWGIVLGAMACIFLILAFWYIVNLTTQQQNIISNLNESERKVKEASRLKEQFMANMSHEIRTPMNSIIGFTGLLKRSPLNEDQKQYVQNINTAGENLLALVNDILDLSKIEAGMMHLEETNFSLRSLTGSVGGMFIEKVKEKHLKFTIDIANDVPDILNGDAVRLTQVLVNLLSNAVKFTERGEIKIVITTVSSTEQNVRLRIVIADTGIGIAQEKQSSIFDRFQQAESETTRRFGGTGLGLSIVKQLVQMQNGSINLHSQPGRGSEFIVEIDYKIPDADQMLSDALALESKPAVYTKAKVLIAEDNPMNQKLIRHLMKSWDMDFELVSTGTEVVEKLKNENFSLVLMDIQMPEMDGYTATEVVRNELRLNIPIIAMTAHAMMGEKEKCLQLGMNDYISKPIKETVLYNMIAQYAHYTPEETPAQEENPASVFTHVNLNYLHELSGNDPGFERSMMQQFQEQGPEEIKQLKNAIEAAEYYTVKKLAHNLKSTVGYMGLADELHPTLDRIEEAAASKNLSGIDNDLNYLQTVTQHAIQEINAFLAQNN